MGGIGGAQANPCPAPQGQAIEIGVDVETKNISPSALPEVICKAKGSSFLEAAPSPNTPSNMFTSRELWSEIATTLPREGRLASTPSRGGASRVSLLPVPVPGAISMVTNPTGTVDTTLAFSPAPLTPAACKQGAMQKCKYPPAKNHSHLI